jgi:glutamine amidotransferase
LVGGKPLSVRFFNVPAGRNADFYYLHSYQAVPDNSAVITITSGEETVITAGIRQGNIFGVQFHPEKSHKAGLKLLQGFAGAAS